MDLGAYELAYDEMVNSYIKKNYGEVPRCRGVRFMKVEESRGGDDAESDLHDKYVGTDTIYIQTRCGHCGMGYDDEDSNYVYCGAKAWEEKNKNKFLEHVTEEFDHTYCTHYFKAVVNDEYNKILDLLKEDQSESD